MYLSSQFQERSAFTEFPCNERTPLGTSFFITSFPQRWTVLILEETAIQDMLTVLRQRG